MRTIIVLFGLFLSLFGGLSAYAVNCTNEFQAELTALDFGSLERPNSGVEKTANEITVTLRKKTTSATYMQRSESGPVSIMISASSISGGATESKHIALSSECKLEWVSSYTYGEMARVNTQECKEIGQAWHEWEAKDRDHSISDLDIPKPEKIARMSPIVQIDSKALCLKYFPSAFAVGRR